MGTYGQTNPKGRLSARLDNHRQIEFNASELVTSTTATPSSVTAPRASPPNAFSFTPILASTRTCSIPASRYVSIRAGHEATLFTDDVAKLGPQLAAEVSKTSAWEIKLHPLGWELGWGSDKRQPLRRTNREGEDDNYC
jgi:hypothetical protein